MNQEQYKKAGFWIRFKAIWIDTLILIIGMKIFFFLILLQPMEFYLPFDLTTLIAGIIYSSFFIAYNGQTIGKKICGLTVFFKNDIPIRFFRLFLRESVGKIISTIFLFGGFIMIGISKSKLGWHDYLSGSQVLRTALINRKQTLASFFIPLLITGFLLKDEIVNSITLYPKAIAFKINPIAEPDYQNREESGIREVSSLNTGEDSLFVNWLDKNAKTPEEYAIESAKNHQVTIFGERHNIKNNLDFLNKIIPDLYKKAGVRCIAMECIPSSMNNKVKKLITEENYDRALALEIARSESWEWWMSKEYWNVLETVWKLNRSISAESDKMQVIGIDIKIDMPSFSLLGIGEYRMTTPILEKTRIFRLPNILIKGGLRDEIMAVNIEREIIETGKKAIVWIGTEHTYTHYAPSYSIMGEKKYRMGYLLHNKYGDKIFQIFLTPMSDFIEKVMNNNSNTPVGFDLKDSPFSNLRDTSSWRFFNQPKTNFNDIARGYIFLKPSREMKSCEYMEGYISKEMLMKNKFFYENFFRGKIENKIKDTLVEFRNSKEANAYYKSIWNNIVW